ncbi:caspase, EACC1-associated type [Streptomyces sp. CA-132043]|uniref:caspase family protein n=1 Tax=Streptomyces sp. CA-132043 TaxID=3240048 RepID=UPI003D91BDFD
MPALADTASSAALLVGVPEYDVLDDLPTVASNLVGLREVLTDPAVWGLPSDRCTVLAQPGHGEQILDAVQETERRATDTLLVYYAGHGLIDPHSDELLLALPKSDPERPDKALRFEFLRRAVREARARRTVVILDCCYSGRALAGRMSASDDIASHARVAGTCVLTASSENHTALAPPEETYTAFTGELITALAEGIPGAPDPIDMISLWEHLRRNLEEKSRPVPQQTSRDAGARIALARNRAAQPSVPPVPLPPSPGPSTVSPLAGHQPATHLQSPALPSPPDPAQGRVPRPQHRRHTAGRTIGEGLRPGLPAQPTRREATHDTTSGGRQGSVINGPDVVGNNMPDEVRFRRAAEAGDTDAMVKLGVLLQETGRNKGAEAWFRRAVEGREHGRHGQPRGLTAGDRPEQSGGSLVPPSRRSRQHRRHGQPPGPAGGDRPEGSGGSPVPPSRKGR